MKIIQILSHITYGDAISNDVLAIDEMIRDLGYESAVMAVKIHESLLDYAIPLNFSQINNEDLIIFHKSNGDGITGRIAKLPNKKILIYHNITPPEFFFLYDPMTAIVLSIGRIQTKKNLKKFDFAWGDSEYNCRELMAYGMDTKKVNSLSILIPPKKIHSDEKILNSLSSDKGTKLLFIGRISPQKKHEDVIKTYWYVLQQDPNAKLFFVGNWNGSEKYYAKLKGFCADLNLSDEQVVFTGTVTEEEKSAYLDSCDVFVCMSEHEGFCVPLVEAMQHDLPIAAFSAAAIPETMGSDHPLLFLKKDFQVIADAIVNVQKDETYRQEILDYQNKQAKLFDYDDNRQKAFALLQNVIESMKDEESFQTPLAHS